MGYRTALLFGTAPHIAGDGTPFQWIRGRGALPKRSLVCGTILDEVYEQSTTANIASVTPHREQIPHSENSAFYFMLLLDPKSDSGDRDHCPHLPGEKAADTGKLLVLKELSLEPFNDSELKKNKEV